MPGEATKRKMTKSNRLVVKPLVGFQLPTLVKQRRFGMGEYVTKKGEIGGDVVFCPYPDNGTEWRVPAQIFNKSAISPSEMVAQSLGSHIIRS